MQVNTVLQIILMVLCCGGAGVGIASLFLPHWGTYYMHSKFWMRTHELGMGILYGGRFGEMTKDEHGDRPVDWKLITEGRRTEHNMYLMRTAAITSATCGALSAIISVLHAFHYTGDRPLPCLCLALRSALTLTSAGAMGVTAGLFVFMHWSLLKHAERMREKGDEPNEDFQLGFSLYLAAGSAGAQVLAVMFDVVLLCSRRHRDDTRARLERTKKARIRRIKRANKARRKAERLEEKLDREERKAQKRKRPPPLSPVPSNARRSGSRTPSSPSSPEPPEYDSLPPAQPPQYEFLPPRKCSKRSISSSRNTLRTTASCGSLSAVGHPASSRKNSKKGKRPRVVHVGSVPPEVPQRPPPLKRSITVEPQPTKQAFHKHRLDKLERQHRYVMASPSAPYTPNMQLQRRRAASESATAILDYSPTESVTSTATNMSVPRSTATFGGFCNSPRPKRRAPRPPPPPPPCTPAPSVRPPPPRPPPPPYRRCKSKDTVVSLDNVSTSNTSVSSRDTLL